MGCLVIKDEEIVNEFRLNCLDEYIKNINELREFINSCSITDFEDVVKLDVQYIENWSLSTDLKILFQTILVVLKHDGAQ